MKRKLGHYKLIGEYVNPKSFFFPKKKKRSILAKEYIKFRF
jgi:hypothetical protein